MTDDHRAQSYYDEFSATYEQHRFMGYHALLDTLEVEIAEPFCRGRLLEAGCGTGLVLRRLRHLAQEVYGLDLSAGMLSIAQQRKLQVVQSSIMSLPFADETFDTVVSFKVLAHIPEIKAALAELARVTKTGGHLVLEFYNRYSLRSLIKHFKQPSHIGATYNDEDVYTRFDSINEIQTYLPPSLTLIRQRGVRVFTPLAKVHDIPLISSAFALAEHWASASPLLHHLAGFLVVILQKR